jgi:hypothetical protein
MIVYYGRRTIKDGMKRDGRLERDTPYSILYDDLTTYATITQLAMSQPSLNIGSQDPPELHLFLLHTSLIFSPVSHPHRSSLLLPASSCSYPYLHPDLTHLQPTINK